MVCYMSGETAKRPAREYVPTRIGAAGVAWVERIALEEDGRQTKRRITRSDVIRASLAVARNHEDELRRMLRDQS